MTASSDHSVSPAESIDFWSALLRNYAGPSTTKSGRVSSSPLPCYPRGSIPVHGSSGTVNLRVFKSLELPSSLVDEMASCMAVGKMVSLTIPVLASFYRGLHLITTTRCPTNSGSYLPVHYLLGWIGTYLRVYSPVKKYPPEAVLSSGDEARTEIVDSDESFGCMVTEVADLQNEAQVEIVDSTGPSDRRLSLGLTRMEHKLRSWMLGAFELCNHEGNRCCGTCCFFIYRRSVYWVDS
ncbi:hypothetical protein LIER_23411 [Lithospermum erythrorhizon]|uniref:Aminotransferase-like plant mobile domain-containing protein n=1 Tax=Lithospermum erythrorhizon TaxID=34254 RepID=A0AAV3QXE2_LITER